MIVDASSEGAHNNLAAVGDKIEIRVVDLRDREITVSDRGIDVIVYLGAKIGGIDYFHHVLLTLLR